VTPIPTLHTERLLLRALEPRDVEPYAAMMADPEVTRHLGDGRPLGRGEAWRQMAMFLGHWTLRGFGIWAVESRATGAFLGRIGCFEPDGWPGFEVGYAREGAAAALRWARETLGRDEIISVIRPDNAPSIRVATALGATLERSPELFGRPARVYRYPRG
jgi:RimJ/RimL family protein N-acetyltransferase